MKLHCSLHLKRAVPLLGLPLIGLTLAGDAPTPGERFTTADADVSGGLSPAEFASTFTPALSKGQQKKQFRDADDNSDGSIDLPEWLAYLRDIVLKDPDATPTEKFEVADGDASASLTLQEFALLLPGKKALIEFRKRHLMADTSDDDLVTLEEWLAYVENPQPDTSGIPFRKFDLADLDKNGELTPDEFALVFPPAVKASVLDKKFAVQDESGDGLLTRDEWNPGGQNAL